MPFSFLSAAKLWELSALGALLLALFSGTWFASKAHYAVACARFEGEVKGQADAQGAQFKEQAVSNRIVTKGVDDAASKDAQIQSMGSVISDLSLRLGAASAARGRPVPQGGDVRPAAPRPEPAHDQPTGPAAPAGPGFTPDDCRTSYGGYDPLTLLGALRIGLGSVDTEIFFRQYARDTGQWRNVIAPPASSAPPSSSP